MEVFEFNKTLLDRLNESMDILQSQSGAVIPSSVVRNEWAYYIELQIEPAGWQALWRIPRVICESLNITFPTIVYGTVDSVYFKELSAKFQVIAVSDDDVDIPFEHEVQLEDLWPTKQQENSAINIEETANCIDMLRFFYKNIWMPWDNDNDDNLNWSDKYLEPRIRFHYDMKMNMSKSLATHAKLLLTEARYIRQRLDNVERDLDEDDALNTTCLSKKELSNLTRLHLRMAILKNEYEILENPEMRDIFEEIKFPTNENCLNESSSTMSTYLITKAANIDDHCAIILAAKEMIDSTKCLQICSSLQDCLGICSSNNEIFISTGLHTVKFLESLSDNGRICSISSINSSLIRSNTISANKFLDSKEHSVIATLDEGSILFMFDNNFTIENVVLDCRNVRTGILIRKGVVHLKNCILIGDERSSTNYGISVSGGATLELTECLVVNFATAISCFSKSKLSVTNTIIRDCSAGIECNSDNFDIKFNGENEMINIKRYGIQISTKQTLLKNKIILSQISDLNCIKCTLGGSCQFIDNKLGNIVLYKLGDLNHLFKDVDDVNIGCVGNNVDDVANADDDSDDDDECDNIFDNRKSARLSGGFLPQPQSLLMEH